MTRSQFVRKHGRCVGVTGGTIWWLKTHDQPPLAMFLDRTGKSFWLSRLSTDLFEEAARRTQDRF